MKQLTLTIADHKIRFFKELLKNFDFVKLTEERDIELTDEQIQYVDGLKKALKQVDDHMSGKIKLQSAKDFLDEL